MRPHLPHIVCTSNGNMKVKLKTGFTLFKQLFVGVAKRPQHKYFPVDFVNIFRVVLEISPLKMYGSSHRKCSVKKDVLKISQFRKKTSVLESLFNKKD